MGWSETMSSFRGTLGLLCCIGLPVPTPASCQTGSCLLKPVENRLVQHVSAVEGTDRVDLASLYDPPDNASLQLGRRLSLTLTLSYDPLPRIAPAATTEKLEPEGAYKISTTKRIGMEVPPCDSQRS